MKNGKITGIKIVSFLLMAFVISLHSAAKDDGGDKNKSGVISWNKKDVEFVKAVEQTKWNEYNIENTLMLPVKSDECDEKYKEDFVSWLSLVMKKQIIPKDITKHLMVYKDENYQQEKRIRWDGFIVRFETSQYHFHVREGRQSFLIVVVDKIKPDIEAGAEKHLGFVREIAAKIFKNNVVFTKEGNPREIKIMDGLSNEWFTKGHIDFYEEDKNNKKEFKAVCPLREGVIFSTDGKTVWFSFVKATIEEKYDTGMAMVFGYPKTRFESLALLKPELLDKNGWKLKPIKYIDDDERDEDKDKKDDKDKDKGKEHDDKSGQPDKKESLPPPVRDK